MKTHLEQYEIEAYPCVCNSEVKDIVQGDSKRWTHLNSKRRLNTRQTVAVFQVLCLLCGLTCVGYAQNSLEFVSCSPLILAKNLVLHSSHFALN